MGEAQLDPERVGFDKWQMYQLIRGEDIGPCCVPETSLLSAETLVTYLTQYKRVYVKPTGAWGGSNISLVESNSNDTSLLWTYQGQHASAADSNQILHHYNGVPAIVQQAIPALLYNGCPFDIRVHMQRDVDENWTYAGELVRVGGEHGIVSNIGVSNGTVLPLSTVTSALLSVDDHDVGVLKQRIVEIGANICRLFSEYSFFQEVGIDLAMDATQRLWLIEINTNDAYGAPSHELFRQLPDETVYREIQQRAMSRNLDILEFLSALLDNTVE